MAKLVSLMYYACEGDDLILVDNEKRLVLLTGHAWHLPINFVIQFSFSFHRFLAKAVSSQP